jgi:hypothetical protein
MNIPAACPRRSGLGRYACIALALAMWTAAFAIATDRALGHVAFQDDTFNDADWTATVFFTSGNGGTGSAAQSIDGGNPGAYRGVTHQMGSRPAQLAMAHECAGATYDPQTQGAISSIAFSFDAATFFDPGYGGQSATVAIRQDGVYYGGPFFANGADIWRNTTHTGLVARDFTEWGVPGSNPDFSASGGPLQFGLITSNTNPADGIIGSSTTIVGYDNWTVLVTQHVSNADTRGVLPQIAHAAAPNPCTRGTAIRFALERSTEVDVGVFDASGRELRHFELHTLMPGLYSVSWDGRDASGQQAPIGTYFYRIVTDAQTATGRLVVMR